MSEQELQNLVGNMNKEITALELKKQKYENMNNKIIEALSQINDAKKNSIEAYTALRANYLSKVKSKEDRDFEELSIEIDTQSSQLNQVLQTSKEEINKINSQISAKTGEMNRYQKQLNEISNTTSSKSSSISNLSANSSGYYSQSSYNGSSIIDALKSIGVDSSHNNIKQLAVANGITNYTGTADQNIKLLNLFKKGQLKK